MRTWIQSYIDELGAEKAKSYNIKTAEFRDKLERLQFLAWLRKRIVPEINPDEFNAWKKAKKHDERSEIISSATRKTSPHQPLHGR